MHKTLSGTVNYAKLIFSSRFKVHRLERGPHVLIISACLVLEKPPQSELSGELFTKLIAVFWDVSTPCTNIVAGLFHHASEAKFNLFSAEKFLYVLNFTLSTRKKIRNQWSSKLFTVEELGMRRIKAKF